MFNSYSARHPEDADELVLQVFDEEELHFFGTVISDRTSRTGNLLIRVEVDSVRIRDMPIWFIPFTAEALIRPETWLSFIRTSDKGGFDQRSSGPSALDKELLPANYENEHDSIPEYPSTGAYLQFSGNLQRPESIRNPHQFDYAGYLERQGIHCQIFVSEIHDSSRQAGNSFWLRQRIGMKNGLETLFSAQNAGLARAIIMGDRSKIDPELRTEFSRAGLAHLMAVSGMHVGFVLLPLWFVLPWFRSSHGTRIAGLLTGGLLLLLYAGVTGFSVSVSRASLMAFFMILARLYHKPGTSMNILGAAAFILLLLDPLMLFEAGFQLSFLAVIIILTTLPGTRYLLPPGHRYRKTGALFQFVMVSVLVQGGLYPVLIHYFQEFSLAGPVSNTLTVPLVQVMFLWTFVCLGISTVHPALAMWLNTPGDLIITGLTEYVSRVGTHPASWIETTLPGSWVFGIWFFGVAILGSLRIPALRWKMVCGLLACVILLQAGLLRRQLRHPELRVTFFDVGQADAILLQTPGGRSYLYDTGVWTPNYDSAERILIPELNAMGIRKLDGIILSHPHADHIGGMPSLLEQMPVDTIYQSSFNQSSMQNVSGIYHRYMKRALEKEIPIRELSTGDMIGADPSLPMLVLSPSDKIKAPDPNNHSIVLLILYGKSRLLLTGDAGAEAEHYLVDTFRHYLRADLLKIGHHGSRTSSTGRFLEHVDARQGVASLALHNRYRHPHPEASRRIRDSGMKTHFTSLEGAVIYRSNGMSYKHVPWKKTDERSFK